MALGLNSIYNIVLPENVGMLNIPSIQNSFEVDNDIVNDTMRLKSTEINIKKVNYLFEPVLAVQQCSWVCVA